ncbi:ORF162 [White spot syndrome virus]|uniref:ORF162 n=1 Tax=White spot syndrome virus TaxID=342409 RepID=A0A2D3I6K4_9VIRU|nr:ORF162 [White spot syndrome virus]
MLALNASVTISSLAQTMPQPPGPCMKRQLRGLFIIMTSQSFCSTIMLTLIWTRAGVTRMGRNLDSQLT